MRARGLDVLDVEAEAKGRHDQDRSDQQEHQELRLAHEPPELLGSDRQDPRQRGRPAGRSDLTLTGLLSDLLDVICLLLPPVLTVATL